MPDWAIVLLAAFGGGLAGAVLQPVVSYALQRVRSKEEIRKSRERGLRFMLEVELDWAGYLLMACDIGLLREEIGVPLSVEDKMAMTGSGVLMYPKGVPPWNPDRIRDTELRELVDGYYGSVRETAQVFYLPQIDREKVRSLRGRLDELGAQIRRRMDELNWPEADYWASVGRP